MRPLLSASTGAWKVASRATSLREEESIVMLPPERKDPPPIRMRGVVELPTPDRVTGALRLPLTRRRLPSPLPVTAGLPRNRGSSRAFPMPSTVEPSRMSMVPVAAKIKSSPINPAPALSIVRLAALTETW